MICIIIFSFIFNPLFAIEIFIAPISYIDSREEKVISRIEISKELANEAERYLYRKEIFLKEIKNAEINAPVSMIDAIKVSREEKAEYLLYGFVEKKEYTYRGEIKLLDYEKREISTVFYSSDDLENYERLIKDLSYKIVTYFDMIFDLKLAEEEPGKLRLSVPISLGYWSYISSDWMNTVTGTGAVSTGLDLITNDKIFPNFKHKTYLSWNLNIEYRYGIGKDEVELSGLHIINLSMPLRVHIESLSKEDGIFLGFGFLYEFDIANIEEKYAGDKRSLYTHIGILGSFGYQWKLNEKIRICFDNIIEVGFQERVMVSFSPRIRALYCIYTKEVTDKWK